MHKKIEAKKALFYMFHISVSVLAVLLLLLFGTDLSTKFLQWMLIVVFIENCLLSLLGEFFSLYQLFLFTGFFFVYSRVFLDVIGFRPLYVFNFWGPETGYLTELNAKIVVITLIVFLLSTSLAEMIYLIYDKQSEIKRNYYFHKHVHLKVLNLLQSVYYLLILLSIVKGIIIIQQVAVNGYTWLFDGGIQSYAFPIFLRVQTLTVAVFSLLLYYKRDKKSVLQNSILLMIFLGVRMFSGQRGVTILYFLLLLWIYSTYYKKIKFLHAGILCVIVWVIIQFISAYRAGRTSINLQIFSVLYSFSVSIMVLGGVIQFESSFTNQFPFVIGYFVDYLTKIFNPLMRLGQNMERLVYGNYLGDHLAYILSPQRYLAGNGTGTSIIAELYEFVSGNQLLFFVCGFLFMLIILFAANRLYKNIFTFTIMFHVLYYFIFSPRDSIFKAINVIVLGLLVAVVVQLFEQKQSNYWLKANDESDFSGDPSIKKI